MSIQKTIERISHLDFLIRSRNTGCAYQLAAKLKVSERTIFYYLRELRDLGAPITWSETLHSYIYKDPGRILFCFSSDYPPEQRLTDHFSAERFKNPGRQELLINH